LNSMYVLISHHMFTQILNFLFGIVFSRKIMVTHCYFTRLNLRKMGPFYFYFPVFLGINGHPKQKVFLNSCEGFLRAPLTEQGHPSPF
jgi:hypothetical protein